MRVDQLLVDPVAAALRQARDVQLAYRQHHLAHRAIDLVAVDVDIGEVVVAPNDLCLAERLEQGPVVPQPQVGERRRVVVEQLAGERRLAGELALLDRVELERRARRRDVVRDVRPLDVELVRLDAEALDEGRIQAADEETQDEPCAAGQREQPERAREDVAEHEQRGDERDAGQDDVGRHLGVEVGVGRRLERAVDAARRVREVRDVELVAGGDRDEQQRTQDREVGAHRRREPQLPLHRARGIDPQREQDDDDERRDGPSLHEAQERQVEDVEADVAAEVRIGLAEVGAVEPEQHRLPDAGPGTGRDQADESRQHGEPDRHGA